ncbi:MULTISPECIES: hypothetical protein [unclassified Rhizobium]|uniref:hypothetical protein n=1 Tax=unclassified Rhizobium TaxID=2613769 RepID=UPI001FD91882|nr:MULTISPECIES: hypothetical protein [unclassified Rhizobium]MBP2463919.1 hypothetical protein [Rhizobium sp. PvP014]MBP2532285.1 hypothetical protein [Rhizobium sp. PvP099]
MSYPEALKELVDRAEDASTLPQVKQSEVKNTQNRHKTTASASTEFHTRMLKNRGRNQIQDTVYVRAPLELTNRFKEFCNEQGFSYGEGLEELMREAKI